MKLVRFVNVGKILDIKLSHVEGRWSYLAFEKEESLRFYQCYSKCFCYNLNTDESTVTFTYWGSKFFTGFYLFIHVIGALIGVTSLALKTFPGGVYF
eukprot:UN16982